MVRVAWMMLTAAAAFAATADFSWNGTLAAGLTLEVKGVNGPVRVVEGSGAGVSVKALREGRRDDPNGVRIAVVPHAGGVTVCAVYPSTDGRPNECAAGGGGRMNVRNNDVRVEFDIELPRGVRLVAKTVNGNVEARRMSEDVKAETVNGNIVVEAQGSVEAKTVNGGITLRLAEGAGAAVDARVTNGEIESDFPLTVRGRIDRRQLDATIGNGGKELKLHTVNGSIRIRRAS